MWVTRRYIEKEIIERAENRCKDLYKAAIKLNVDDLDNMLKALKTQYQDQVTNFSWLPNYRVGENYVQPCILQLIRDGKIDSAKFLYDRAAHNPIVHYLFLNGGGDDLINHIAYYAALCGFSDFCGFLLEDHLTRSPSITYCILGAAEINDYDYLEKLLAECPNGIRYAIERTASSGDIAKAEELLARNDNKHISQALWGAARGGHQHYVFTLLQRETISPDSIYVAACVAMHGGHCKLGEILLARSGRVLTDISDSFIANAVRHGDIDQHYIEELQIKVLLNTTLNLHSKTAIMQHINYWRNIAGNPCLPYENVVNRTLKILPIKSAFPATTDAQCLAIMDPENYGAFILLLQMSIRSGLKKGKGTSQFCHIPYVALLRIFSVIFGAEPHIIYNQNAPVGGFGQLLFTQAKMIEALRESKESKCCIQ